MCKNEKTYRKTYTGWKPEQTPSAALGERLSSFPCGVWGGSTNKRFHNFGNSQNCENEHRVYTGALLARVISNSRL